MNISILEIINDAAKRFNSRPIYRASIEARTELKEKTDAQSRESANCVYILNLFLRNTFN